MDLVINNTDKTDLCEYLWSLPVNERFQHIAKVYRMQQKEIAIKTNTSQNMVWRWFQGIARPGEKNAELLSQLFQLPQEIFRDSLKPSTVSESVYFLKSTNATDLDTKKILASILDNKNYFLFKMPNSSMETDRSDCISSGDLLFIESFTPSEDITKDSSFLVGKTVLIKTDNCYFLGKLTMQFKEKEYLVTPNNPRIFQPFKINDFSEIIGTVKYVLHEY